jgi:diadenosine tetraphosphate (Ap4A) HIT family hydrolase
MRNRQPFDLETYVKNIQTRPCFICEILKGNPEYRHHLVYEDNIAIAFLNKYPTLLGYVVVCPKEHREMVTGDFSLDEYLALQRVVYQIGEAVRRSVPTERLYVLSLGSQQGNRHVHWHIAPLPPGVPFEEQQCEAVSVKEGILYLSEDEMAAMAALIRGNIEGL